MYLYGCSVGGIVSSQYIINDNENTPYSGMVAYGSAFAIDETQKGFMSRLWGAYDWGIGRGVNTRLRKILPDLAKHTSKEQMEIYNDAVYNKFQGITTIHQHMVVPMYGYKDMWDYYRQVRIAGKLHKIKRCPTMYLQSWDD